MKVITAIWILWATSLGTFSQVADTLYSSNNWQVHGYLKHLQQATFTNRINELTTSNLIHNRVRLQWQPATGIQLRADLRNRIFYGEQIRANPNFTSMLENPNDYLDLSDTWYSKGAIVAQSTIDRLYCDFTRNQWEITIGRQRINWGISTLWTPNDLFNTYNFFDFDYEERPGSDAIRVRYTPKAFTQFEWAYKAGRTPTEHIGAMLYRFNVRNYDVQAFAGALNTDLASGIGWAGNILNTGCKGEFTLLQPLRTISSDSLNDALGTVSIDYVWKNGWYTNLSYLYHHNGSNEFSSLTGFYSTRISLRTMMPFQHSLSMMVNKSITPLLTAGGVIIYSNASRTIIAVPSLSYFPAENWEILLTAQLFYAVQDNRYTSLSNTLYIRMKFAF